DSKQRREFGDDVLFDSHYVAQGHGCNDSIAVAYHIIRVAFDGFYGNNRTQFKTSVVLVQEFNELVCGDRKSTRLNSSHVKISYAVFCLKKKNKYIHYYKS